MSERLKDVIAYLTITLVMFIVACWINYIIDGEYIKFFSVLFIMAGSLGIFVLWVWSMERLFGGRR